jgi:hypothetical protein
MKYPIKRDASGMRASYKRSDFGEIERSKYVALARAALMQNTVTEALTVRPAVEADIKGMRTLPNEIIRVGGTTAITNEPGRVRIKMRTIRCLCNHRRIANVVRTVVHTLRFGRIGCI